MCGIAGIFSRDGARIEPRAVERMCDALVHRGPDDVGVAVSGPVTLGLRRLSIIDIVGGHQPMTTTDGSLMVAFNGEIYDYRELRRELESFGHSFRTNSDTECLLHGYRQWGDSFVEHLNGMFAIALWDQGRQRLLLARDRLGIKPLYVRVGEREVHFASEIKALLVDPSAPRRLDRAALSYFLRYGYVAAPRTFLEGIHKLPPAHMLVVDGNQVTCRRYWQADFIEAPARVADRIERVREGVTAAVVRQLVADVPVGAFLSGGLDSSSIVGILSAAGKGPVRTYSVGFAGADAPHDEREDAAAVAAWSGTHHEHTVVTSGSGALIEQLVGFLDQPLGDSSFGPTYLVSKLAAGSVKVVLSGVGGEVLRRLSPLPRPVARSAGPVAAGPIRSGLRSLVGRLPVDRESFVNNYARLGMGLLRTHHLDPFDQYDHAVRLMDEDTITRLLREPAGVSDLDEARRQAWHRPGASADLHRMMRLDLETSCQNRSCS